jgi:hypothetical protein
VKKVLRTGDIVILPLEYSHFLYQGEYSTTKSFYIRTYDIEYFRSLPLAEKAADILQTSPDDFILSLTEQLTSKAMPSISDKQSLDRINENGDSIINIGNKKDSLANILPIDIQKEAFVETLGLKTIKDFNTWCLNNRIKLYVTFANTVYFKDYENQEYRIYFKNLLKYFAENSISTIGTPYDFFYDVSFFFDTQYHLNQEGVTLRTNQFIARMKAIGITNSFSSPVIGVNCATDYRFGSIDKWKLVD